MHHFQFFKRIMLIYKHYVNEWIENVECSILFLRSKLLKSIIVVVNNYLSDFPIIPFLYLNRLII